MQRPGHRYSKELRRTQYRRAYLQAMLGWMDEALQENYTHWLERDISES
jgi:hypothetical protein